METTEEPTQSKRTLRVVISIVVLSAVTVVFGYGGWIALTLTANTVGYDPRTDDGDPLRERLRVWPDRNREVMRTNGREPLPLRP